MTLRCSTGDVCVRVIRHVGTTRHIELNALARPVRQEPPTRAEGGPRLWRPAMPAHRNENGHMDGHSCMHACRPRLRRSGVPRVLLRTVASLLERTCFRGSSAFRARAHARSHTPPAREFVDACGVAGGEKTNRPLMPSGSTLRRRGSYRLAQDRFSRAERDSVCHSECRRFGAGDADTE